MRILKIEPNERGGFQMVTADYITPENIPDGWAAVPDDLEIPETFPFVNVEIEGNTVVSMTAGEVPEPEPEPEPEPSAADDVNEMLIDHEYRLTLIELGITE